jgi:hypothetical protein
MQTHDELSDFSNTDSNPIFLNDTFQVFINCRMTKVNYIFDLVSKGTVLYKY